MWNEEKLNELLTTPSEKLIEDVKPELAYTEITEEMIREKANTKGKVTVNVDGLIIRSDASTSSNRIGNVKNGKTYPVYEQKEITVSKTNKVSELSGDVINYNQIEIFTKVFDINKKERYNDSTLTKKVIFNIPYLLCVNKIEEYEKNDIIYTYDKESAVKYAATIIEDEFIKNKVLNDEKILRIQELVVIEDEESFKITFLIKKIESIGEFKENV